MKDYKNPDSLIEEIKKIQNHIEQPHFDLEAREDIKVNIRVDEKISPAMFKPDPLIPGGYVANSLTIRAMRPDIFVLGDSFEDSFEDLKSEIQCACGKVFDVQFWKLCPYCAKEISL